MQTNTLQKLLNLVLYFNPYAIVFTIFLMGPYLTEHINLLGAIPKSKAYLVSIHLILFLAAK